MSFFRVLPTPTRRVFRRISGALKDGPEEVRDGVRLVGGTAPALHPGRRRSRDVDLMTETPEAVPAVARSLRPALSPTVVREAPDFIQWEAGDIGVDPAVFPDPPVRLPGIPYLPVAPLRVLAASKAATLAGRRTLRDYIDVYFLLQAGFTLRELLSLADAGTPGFSAYDFARALREFRERADDPAEAEYWSMVMQPVTRDEMERVFREAAGRIERAYAKRRDGTREAIRRAHRSSFRRCSRRAWAATERAHRHSSRRRSRRA
jgi:hypothetical protein